VRANPGEPIRKMAIRISAPGGVAAMSDSMFRSMAFPAAGRGR
jgi:hypothetical protein